MISTIYETIELILRNSYEDLTVPIIRTAYYELLPQVFADLGLNFQQKSLEQYLSSLPFEHSCPIGYADLGNSTCQSHTSVFSDASVNDEDRSQPTCDRLDFSGIGIIGRLELMNSCSLDGWSQILAEPGFLCPNGWNVEGENCVSSTPVKERCSSLPIVDELNRETNARRCSAELISSVEDNLTSLNGSEISLPSQVYSSIADSFLQQTAHLNFSDFGPLLDAGYFDSWLKAANIHLSDSLDTCARGFVGSGNSSLCLLEKSTASRCPPQYQKSASMSHKLLIYSICEYSDDPTSPVATPDRHAPLTPDSYIESNMALPELEHIQDLPGPIKDLDGEIMNPNRLNLWKDENIRYDDALVESSLSFLSVRARRKSGNNVNDGNIPKGFDEGGPTITPASEMGLLRGGLLAWEKVLPQFIVKNSLRKTEAEFVLFEDEDFAHEARGREICVPEAIECPTKTVQFSAQTCMVEDPRDNFNTHCPYRGLIPAKADAATRQVIEEVCGYHYACRTCNMDFNNYECPESWIYETDTKRCLNDLTHNATNHTTIDVSNWTANDRATYAFENHLTWPCVDKEGCKRDFSGMCPEKFASLEILGPSYSSFCISSSNPSAGLCPSTVARTDPVMLELENLYEQVVGKPLRFESVVIWNASESTEAKINLSAICGARWPCEATCKVDYKLPCAIGWMPKGSLCSSVNLSQTNHCGLASYSSELTVKEKKTLAAFCGLLWPCRKHCQQDFSKHCPHKWVAVKSKNTIVCALRKPIIHTYLAQFEVTGFTADDKKDYGHKHGLNWPCAKSR